MPSLFRYVDVVKFTLEVLRGDSVESASRVWSGNERDQELLTEDALDDLIPSFY
jgi:ParB family chromosome partitioning protein